MSNTIMDEDQNVARIDAATEAIDIIDYPHHEIHAGRSYTLTGTNEDLDTGLTFGLTVYTPITTRWFHATWEAQGTLATHIKMWENPITATPGTDVPPVNRNRNSSNMSLGSFREDDTFTSSGTLLWQWHAGDKKSGGTGGVRQEFVLAPGSQYLFQIESEADTNKVSGGLEWYEHTDRN